MNSRQFVPVLCVSGYIEAVYWRCTVDVGYNVSLFSFVNSGHVMCPLSVSCPGFERMFLNPARLEVIASCTLTNSGRRANTRVRCSRGKTPMFSCLIRMTWLLMRYIVTKKIQLLCAPVCDAHLNSWQCHWYAMEDHHVIDKLTPVCYRHQMRSFCQLCHWCRYTCYLLLYCFCCYWPMHPIYPLW